MHFYRWMGWNHPPPKKKNVDFMRSAKIVPWNMFFVGLEEEVPKLGRYHFQLKRKWVFGRCICFLRWQPHGLIRSILVANGKSKSSAPFFWGLRQRATRSRGIVRGERCEDALGLVECTLAKSRKKEVVQDCDGWWAKKTWFSRKSDIFNFNGFIFQPSMLVFFCPGS